MKDMLLPVGLVLFSLFSLFCLFVLSAGVDNYKLCAAQKACRLPSNGTIWRLEHGGKLYRRLVLISDDQFEAIKAAKRSPSPAQVAVTPTHSSSGPTVTVIIDDRAIADELAQNAPPPQVGRDNSPINPGPGQPPSPWYMPMPDGSHRADPPSGDGGTKFFNQPTTGESMKDL